MSIIVPIMTFHRKYSDIFAVWSLLSEQKLQAMGGSPDELSEELVTQEKRKKGWRMNSDVGEATEGLDNEL